ncbi:MAG: ribosomal protein S18-alanine N-acetyltransferase [Nitratireductor sp.]
MIANPFRAETKIAPLKAEELEEVSLHAIAQIHKAGFSKAWDEREIVSTLNNNGVWCLVAKQKDTIIGFLIYRITLDEAEIITIATSPKHRQQGAGANLLYEMQRHCLIERVKKIFLEVDGANLGAISLYKKSGYVKIGERKGYYSNEEKDDSTQGSAERSDAHIMQLDLSA